MTQPIDPPPIKKGNQALQILAWLGPVYVLTIIIVYLYLSEKFVPFLEFSGKSAPFTSLLKMLIFSDGIFAFVLFMLVLSGFIIIFEFKCSAFLQVVHGVITILAGLLICLALWGQLLNLVYETGPTAQTDIYRYHVVVHEPFESVSTYSLYRCILFDIGCERICSCRWAPPGPIPTRLLVDKITNEVYFFRYTDLICSAGARIRSFTQRAWATWGDKSYQYGLASTDLPAAQEFVMFRCNTGFDYNDCDFLPFSYVTPSKYSEKTLKKSKLIICNERDCGRNVSVYINDQLIYVYGDEPKCYVEGCSLTRKYAILNGITETKLVYGVAEAIYMLQSI